VRREVNVEEVSLEMIKFRKARLARSRVSPDRQPACIE